MKDTMANLPDRTITAPAQTPESTRYWEAANAGQMLLRRCNQCGKPHFYPRTLCPFCLGNTEWEATRGEGTVYSYSVMRHAEQPYVIAYVQLAEGPIVMTNIVDCTAEAVRIDMPVRLVFKPSREGPAIPMFMPA